MKQVKKIIIANLALGVLFTSVLARAADPRIDSRFSDLSEGEFAVSYTSEVGGWNALYLCSGNDGDFASQEEHSEAFTEKAMAQCGSSQKAVFQRRESFHSECQANHGPRYTGTVVGIFKCETQSKQTRADDSTNGALPPEVFLDGQYKVELKNGDQIYIDQLQINGPLGPMNLKTYNGDVQGKVTVHGVSADLYGQVKCSMWAGECSLQFQAMFEDQDHIGEIYFQLLLPLQNYIKALYSEHSVVLTGSAFRENGQLVGFFRATKQ